MERIFLVLLALSALTVSTAAAQPSEHQEEGGVLVRIGGDVALGSQEHSDVVVVVDGSARIAGTAEVVVVVDGTATLTDARVSELVVVDGEADLQGSTVVAGDVHLIDAELDRSEAAVVEGTVLRDANYRIGRGLLIFGLLFGLGYVIAVLLSGLAAAAVAPRRMRRAGAALTDDFGPTLLAAVVLWVGLPIAAGLALLTVVGLPVGLGILLFLLPALGFLGYLVAGLRLGDALVARSRGAVEPEHPYLAAVVGLGLLLIAGWTPFLGAVVTPIAAILGSGAIALLAARSVRRPKRPAPSAA